MPIFIHTRTVPVSYHRDLLRPAGGRDFLARPLLGRSGANGFPRLFDFKNNSKTIFALGIGVRSVGVSSSSQPKDIP